MNVITYDVLGKLPDPFLFDNGKRVVTKEDWQKRRQEIYKTAVELQYGKIPPDPEFLVADANTYLDKETVSCTIITGTREKPVRFGMKIFKPNGFGKFPAVVDGDLCFKYPYNEDFIKSFTNSGIMLVLFDRTELAPDRRELGRYGQLYDTYKEYDFGAIAAWAWGYSRCVDALEKFDIVDSGCITFTGHSRGAKTACLAGVIDERATIVNPNSTCAGSSGCYRIHMSADTEDNYEVRSETLDDLIREYDFWMGPDLKKYRNCEEKLPFDCHFLKSLIAPRVYYDSLAISDIWSNPIGAWQTDMAAKEVYKFLGAESNIYWSFRPGYHQHKVEDVKKLVRLILHIKDKEPLGDGFFNVPFEKPELIFDWRAPLGKNNMEGYNYQTV